MPGETEQTGGFIMNKHLIGALIIAASAAAAGPAFASGYGPAVHYDPISGAPTSQRGQSVQTLRENYNATEAQVTRKTDTRSYGGIADSTSNWGDRAVPAGNGPSPFAHH
jgi:hypothetical protein